MKVLLVCVVAASVAGLEAVVTAVEAAAEDVAGAAAGAIVGAGREREGGPERECAWPWAWLLLLLLGRNDPLALLGPLPFEPLSLLVLPVPAL